MCLRTRPTTWPIRSTFIARLSWGSPSRARAVTTTSSTRSRRPTTTPSPAISTAVPAPSVQWTRVASGATSPRGSVPSSPRRMRSSACPGEWTLESISAFPPVSFAKRSSNPRGLLIRGRGLFLKISRAATASGRSAGMPLAKLPPPARSVDRNPSPGFQADTLRTLLRGEAMPPKAACARSLSLLKNRSSIFASVAANMTRLRSNSTSEAKKSAQRQGKMSTRLRRRAGSFGSFTASQPS